MIILFIVLGFIFLSLIDLIRDYMGYKQINLDVYNAYIDLKLTKRYYENN